MLRARAKYLRRRVRFRGIDISSVAVEWARRRAEESAFFDCSFEERDLNQELQYKDETFDIILCLEVLEHLEEPYSVISEFFRVIRKGGLLIMSTPNKDYPLASMLGKWKSTSDLDSHSVRTQHSRSLARENHAVHAEVLTHDSPILGVRRTKLIRGRRGWLGSQHPAQRFIFVIVQVKIRFRVHAYITRKNH